MGLGSSAAGEIGYTGLQSSLEHASSARACWLQTALLVVPAHMPTIMVSKSASTVGMYAISDMAAMTKEKLKLSSCARGLTELIGVVFHLPGEVLQAGVVQHLRLMAWVGLRRQQCDEEAAGKVWLCTVLRDLVQQGMHNHPRYLSLLKGCCLQYQTTPT